MKHAKLSAVKISDIFSMLLFPIEKKMFVVLLQGREKDHR